MYWITRIASSLALGTLLPAQALLLPSPIALTGGATVSGGCHIGDYDLDGSVDIAIGGDLYRSNGVGGYAVATVRPPVTAPGGIVAGPVAVRDLDQDGDLDFVYFDGVWINNGGTYVDETATRIGASLPTGASVTLVYDADSDGDLDLLAVLVAQAGPSYRLLYLETALNDGTGNFPTRNTRYLAGGSSVGMNGVVSGDFDGDGLQDLAFAGSWFDIGNSGRFGSVLLGPAQALLPGSQVLALRTLRAVADLDGDGADEILTVGNGGSIAYYDGVTPASISPAAGTIHATDFDGDGDVDCVCRATNGSFTLASNSGNGTFSLVPLPIPNAPVYYEEVAFADLDRDGDADVAVTSPPRAFRNARQQLSAPTSVGLLGNLVFTVNATTPAGPVTGVFVTGLSLQSADVPLGALGALLIDPAGLALLPLGSLVGGQGTVAFPIPGTPAIVGLQVFAQALIDDSGGRLHLSNRTRTTIQ
jgi:hypothetical protein